MNNRIISSAVEKSQSVWGKCPYYLMPPKVQKRDDWPPRHAKDKPVVVLPPILMRAWLDSEYRSTHLSCGTQLVITWFQEYWADQSLHEVIYNGVRQVPWKQYAQDFEY
jgi:hypothetical protein